MKTSVNYFRSSIQGILFLALITTQGCAKKQEEPGDLKALLQPSVHQIFEATGLSVSPNSEFLKDNYETRKDERDGGRVEVISIWLVADDTLEHIRGHYEKNFPHILHEEKLEGKTVFLQLSSAKDISAAIAKNTNLIGLVDIRQKPLSESEKAAYNHELAELSQRTKEDLVAKRRTKQIERILSGKPLIKINFRKATALN